VRILLAWELGGGFGHVARLRALAQLLRERGHSCALAVRNLDSAARFFEPELGALLQAPVRLNPDPSAARGQLNYASLLYNCGYDKADGLAARLRAWRALIAHTGSDCLIADHSPTAILAARTLGLPGANVGSGFLVPPTDASPFPAFRHDLKAPADLLVSNEASVLKVTNAALDRIGAAPLPTLQSIFDRCLPALFTYREFDHYECERPVPYLGVPEFSHGVDINWGERREPRVFAYLRPFAGLPALLETLQRLPCQVLLRVNDVDLRQLARFQRPGFVIVDREVHMRRAAESCDVFINHTAHGTVAEMLLQGKPGLMIPNTFEQTLLAHRIAAIGATLTLAPKADAPYAVAMERLLNDAALRRAAEDFAVRYGTQARGEILPAWCDAFLRHAGSASLQPAH
jgi:UDP:flavonoid glycosyltransferase YjiC (YdhE family)